MIFRHCLPVDGFLRHALFAAITTALRAGVAILYVVAYAASIA